MGGCPLREALTRKSRGLTARRNGKALGTTIANRVSMSTTKTAAEIKLACLDEVLADAIRQANEYLPEARPAPAGKLNALNLRVQAIREEMADVRAGR
jgi:hypothetical protein